MRAWWAHNNQKRKGAKKVRRPLLLGNDFKMKMQNIKKRKEGIIVLCLGGNRQPTDSRIWRDLLSSTLRFLLRLPHLSASGAKLQESSLSNKIGYRRRLLLL